jgi:hypothetical protein
MCGLMPTPKPGQIRCPTCHKPTPPAAFCTQCGAAIPASAMPRPRGMDRDELEERTRIRRPGGSALRRGTHLEEDDRPAPAAGYVPFVPEPEDAGAAAHEEEPVESAPNVDNTPDDFDSQQVSQQVSQQDSQGDLARRIGAQAPSPHPETTYVHPHDNEPAVEADAYDEPYGAPDDAYPHAYQAADDGRRRGPGALPIIGFIGLCVLALGVGAALASVLGGGPGVAETSGSPSAGASLQASVEPTEEPSAESSAEASATAGPADEPVTFPDGAQLSIQPCGSSEFDDDAVGRPEEAACREDGSSVDEGDVWAFIVFADTPGGDTLTVQLLENDEVVNEQEMTIDEVLGNCGSSCNGLIYGAHYAGLFPGDYQLVLQREGELADRATFTVEG